MNRRIFTFTCRVAVVLVLASIFTFAFVVTRSSASGEVVNSFRNQKIFAESTRTAVGESPEVAPLKAQHRGFPLINLRDGEKLKTKFVGASGAAQAFGAAQARPLTMTSADLNADGAGDLLVAYADGSGGHLAFYQGSLDTLSARTPEIFEGMKEGRFPAPFLPDVRLIQLPVAPDFVGTGDFNRDGYKDIVATARGGNTLVLLAGSASGNFNPQNIELPGRVTALLAENIDPLDGQPDVALALSGEDGARLLIFDYQHNVFAGQPKIYSLPSEVTSLALGQLDDDAPLDILAAAGGSVVVIRGSYPETNESPESRLSSNAGRVEALSAGAGIVAVRIGHFIWDRENRPEIALLGSDGTIHILQRGSPVTRRYTEEEWEAHWSAQEEKDQIELQRRGADPTNRAAAAQANRKMQRQAAQEWTEADSFQLSSGLNLGAVSPASVFTSARMTTEGVENLIVADAGSRKIRVLLQNNDTLKAAGESYEVSAKGALAAVELDAAAKPAAILPMRLSVMTRPGLVMMDEESGELVISPVLPSATFTISKTADTADGTCNADCSLREAIIAANTMPNAPDTIMVPQGTYTLTLGQSDDSPADPADQDSGDLDIRDDLTIVGQGTVIIEAGTSPANGIDRVLHTRQRALGIPDISISGVTVRHGRCTSAGSIANPNGARCNTGGAGLLHSVDDLGAVTISNSTFTSNWVIGTDAGTGQFFLNGAGVFMGRGDAVLTNVTFTNNETGASGSQHGGEGGAVLFGFSSSTNINTAVLNNCTMTGNIARLIAGDTLGGNGGAVNGAYNDLDIDGGTYSNNSADLDGGAVYNLTNMDIFNNATFTGNSAKRDGGGIWSDPFQYNSDNTNPPTNAAFGPGTNTITNVTIRGNTADSDNGIHQQFPGDPRGAGGGIYHDRNTLNLTNVTIGGTAAGQPNTAYDGGGFGHRYRAVNSTTNLSNVTINGGSIVGNVANNDGGGIFHDATRTAGANSTLDVAPTTNVTLTDNKAKNNGGGISNSGTAIANFKNMTLRSNQANSDSSGGGDGGALYQNNATTTFTGTLTIGGSGFANLAVNGGGIRNDAGAVNIPSGASITHNSATGTGGGISNAGTLSALTNAILTNNSATGNGGGIFNSGTLGTITTPAINSNSAASGGGIFSSSGNLVVSNGSVSSNTGGGGIVHGGSATSSVTGVTINSNAGHGILITANSLDANNNIITNNSADGISKTGAGVGSNFGGNTIHSNGGLGIDLSDNGVTPNDLNDTDGGPNNLQNFPVINYVRRGDGSGSGVANFTLNAANGSYRIQFYANTACDTVGGNGEGEVLLASQNVTVAGNTFTGFSTNPLSYGAREQITATATHDVNNNGNFDDDGNTSEFSACRKVNTLPTIAAQSGVSRQQGSPFSNAQIATVADPDQPLNTLAVLVNGNPSATVNGVTISNIAVNAAGVVTADVVASCTAATTGASFTLRVTDNAVESNETTLTVAVTPNTAPTLGTYPATTLNEGSGTTVTPSAAPTDNGTFTLSVAASPNTLNDDLSINQTTGVVTITGAEPFGTYTVTLTSTDLCGTSTTSQFQVVVNAIPTIAAQAGVTRQKGTAASNSQIATVNDNDQTENTLGVTIRAVGAVAPGTGTATVNGVTVSNIVVNAAGIVTADVVASCTATAASFTLRVTDTNGAFNETTLSVAVTANTLPTLSYPSPHTVEPGASLNVTPTATGDNGTVTYSIFSVTPALTTPPTVDTAGMVSITSANPPGDHTITVRATDNCGEFTDASFVLTVQQPIAVSVSNASISEPSTGSVNMPFTVTLSQASGSAVSVNFQTADGTATSAGGDYTPTSGTLTFAAGQTVQTISVPVLANGDTADEQFTVTLNTPTGGATIGTGTATGTITEANPPGRVLISELRTSGPGGAGDDFVELYNNQDVSQDISGWAVVKMGSTCTATPVVVAVIPASTIIPARGHYLVVGPAYNAADFNGTAGNATVAAVTDIESDRNIGLFNTSNVLSLSTTTREDAVGFDVNAGGGNNCDLLREGATLLSAGGSASQYSFVRNLTTGTPKETNDNAADFQLVTTTPAVAVGNNPTPALGAPGPENLAAPVQRNAVVKSALIDPTVAATVPNNRVRSSFGANPANAAYGTLSIQRRFKNTLGVPATRLRFRIVDLTTVNNRPTGYADLRVLSSNGQVTNSAGTVVVTVTGLTLEGPPQPNGGGLNSTLTVIPPGGSLASGASIDVQFLLGVQEQGQFSFFVNVEALPGPAGSPAPSPGANMKNGTTRKKGSAEEAATEPKPEQ